MNRSNAYSAARGLIALLVIGAIVWQLRIHLGLGYSLLNFFSYFTNLANLLAASVFLRTAFAQFSGKDAGPGVDRTRFMAAINMVIVGIVFSTLLRNVDLGSLLPWINALLHYVMPVLVFVDWIVDPPRRKVSASDMGIVALFPIAYLVYTLVRGSMVNWYPYPFLNPSVVGGYGSVALYSVAITAVFFVTGFALMALRNRARPVI